MRRRNRVGCARVRVCTGALCAAMIAVATAGPDDDSITDLIGTRLACSLVGRAQAEMPVEPLYTAASGRCEAVMPREGVPGTLFSDARCESPVAFAPTSVQAWCDQVSDVAELGTGSGIAATPNWTLTPGNRVNVGARSLAGVLQPYLHRRVYRSVPTATGTCDLEMRVYARHPMVTGQRSMLALHGGSWSSRTFGTFGLEFTVPHFVEQGFVVYAPFYRLLGDDRGPPTCTRADLGEIVEDAGAALDWVVANAERYGSSGNPLVFGQSAGAQLAASLAVNRPDAIAAAVLFYAPVDFEDFVLRAKSGEYTDAQGLDVLQRLLDTTAELADVSASPVPENSFPSLVAANPSAVPPVFLLHGAADTLVEERQSVRLCDALAARPLVDVDQPVPPPDALRTITGCSPTADGATTGTLGSTATGAPVSRLHRIREGDHALDLCLAGTVIPVDSCRSGSTASRELVADSIGQSVAFAAQAAGAADAGSAPDTDSVPDAAPTVSETAGSSSGGGALGWCLAALLWQVAGRLSGTRRFSARGGRRLL